jgi:hypothetical protein
MRHRLRLGISQNMVAHAIRLSTLSAITRTFVVRVAGHRLCQQYWVSLLRVSLAVSPKPCGTGGDVIDRATFTLSHFALSHFQV